MSFGHSAFLTPHSGTTVLEYPLSIEAIIQFILVSHPSTVRVPGTEYSQTFRDERSRISHGGRASAYHHAARAAKPLQLVLHFVLRTHPPARARHFCVQKRRRKTKVRKEGMYIITHVPARGLLQDRGQGKAGSRQGAQGKASHTWIVF